MKDDSATGGRALTAQLIAYYLTLILFFLASFFPDNRIWGFNWWGYYPLWVPVGLFIIGLLAPVGAHLTLRNYFQEDSDIPDQTYSLAVIAITVVFGLLFWLLKAETHFLGDGYQLLSKLAQHKLVVKSWDVGSTTLLQSICDLLPDNVQKPALLTYRLVAVVSGVCFLIVAAVSARAFFRFTGDRILFLCGIATGGYMLLFFGYVENYALFVSAVGAFCLLGLAVSLEKLNRFWILLPLTLALFFHIFGVALIPAAVYLLVAKSRLGEKLVAFPHRFRWVVATLAAAAGIAVFCHYYTTDHFFRFSLVPLVESRFTPEGYTLFSVKHVLDYLNLFLMLFPGLLVVLSLLIWWPVRDFLSRVEYRFLLLVLVCCGAVAFVFDPKLGMPRDWDLFSFAGVPLVIVSYYAILSSEKIVPHRRLVVILSLLLASLLLLPRVGAQRSGEMSLRHFENYIRHDQLRNKNVHARFLIMQYYKSVGDSAGAEKAERRWQQEAVYLELTRKASNLIEAGQPEQAFGLLHQALENNPGYADAWRFLGLAYLLTRQYDSCLIAARIAEGLSPYHPGLYNLLGLIHSRIDEYDRAEKYWRKAVKLDTTKSGPLFNLMRMYQEQGRYRDYFEWLRRLTSRDDAKAEWIRELGDYYLSLHDYEQAAKAYRRALDRGLDSAYVANLRRLYPQLGF